MLNTVADVPDDFIRRVRKRPIVEVVLSYFYESRTFLDQLITKCMLTILCQLTSGVAENFV